MSLLLDTLKKAEKEKAAASRPEQQDGDTQDKVATDSTVASSAAIDNDPSKKIALSLDMGPDEDDSDVTFETTANPAGATDKTTSDPIAQQSSTKNDDTPYSGMPNESETADEETLQHISAVELLKEAGAQDRPTLVTDRTVFVIGRSASSSTLIWKTLSLLIFLSCLVLFFFLFVGAEIGATEPNDDYATTTKNALEAIKEKRQTAEDTEDIASSNTDTDGIAITADCSKPSDKALCRFNAQDLRRLPEETALLNDARSITIRKIQPGPNPAIQLKQAFAAYQAGAYTEANSLYQAVLALAPDNRDALLGSAAIAVQQHDLETAQRHYLHLLKLDPGDKIPLAAMINLYGKKDLSRGERIIKSLLSYNIEFPYLHFVLGNIYAAQARWLYAQQAFFDAYQQEPGNPHYALNLAISLDHIGQYETALEYYTIAVQQVYDSLSFDVTTIQLRIQQLSERQAATL